jgi:hypothetical protein
MRLSACAEPDRVTLCARRRPSGQAVVAIEKVLTPSGIRPGRCRTANSNFFEQRSPVVSVQYSRDRNQPNGFLPMPGQDDFITRSGATHQFGQLFLGVGDGNPHGFCFLETLIVTVGNIDRRGDDACMRDGRCDCVCQLFRWIRERGSRRDAHLVAAKTPAAR